MPEFTVTSKRPVVVMDAAEYQDIQDRLERLEFLEDESLQNDLEEAMKELREGKTTSLEEYKAKRARRVANRTANLAEAGMDDYLSGLEEYEDQLAAGKIKW